jgi:imidazoleglycerol-phosphate dehydratase
MKEAIMSDRRASIQRETKETQIRIELNLDGGGRYEIDTGVPFLDHMLTLMTAYGLIDLEIAAKGDTEIDDHHTVEDIGIVLGTALAQALGDKRGIARYGSFLLPMDEALVQIALDFSGRPVLALDVDFPTEKVGAFDTELVAEFLRALSTHAALTLHVRLLAGSNSHHIAEAIFKALGHALRQAVAIDPRQSGIPSTKGVL